MLLAVPVVARLPPAPNIPTFQPPAASHAHGPGIIHISRRPAPVPVVIAVSPSGSDAADGTITNPFASLARAQVAVRRLNADHDVTVQLANGVYAHHPSRPEMSVRDIVISNNVVRTVSQHYREQAAILVTYASGAVIWHNDVSGAPYDGIDVGWGWGVNDPGGSAAYLTANRGYYNQPGNLMYDTPTILRDSVIVGNRVHDVKQWFPDGGAIYHLSADPGALIAENYVYDVPGGIALYLDEGSRHVTLRNNAISNVGVWLNLNSQDDVAPRRTRWTIWRRAIGTIQGCARDRGPNILTIATSTT
ncbi:hypothetical protein ACSBM8_02415 [Sphingomonas sp. ASY06-1R]|uniref:hypothetical protein n=1 Tax=Sphingomonas sp. ASY06-1R TaxID=3445771 RepID=UPI003FA1CDCE